MSETMRFAGIVDPSSRTTVFDPAKPLRSTSMWLLIACTYLYIYTYGSYWSPVYICVYIHMDQIAQVYIHMDQIAQLRPSLSRSRSRSLHLYAYIYPPSYKAINRLCFQGVANLKRILKTKHMLFIYLKKYLKKYF